MKLIDLSHTISPEMPVYPGTEPPVFITECTIEDTGFLENKITLYSHTGTHIDAPAHLIKDAKTLNMLPITHFYGNAFLLNLAQTKNRTISIDDLYTHQKTIEAAEFLLIHTGWSRYWGSDKYFSDYPILSLEAADWLCGFGLKGIGFDTISADIEDTQDFPVHKAFLQQDTIIIENLTHLDKLPCDHVIFSCFPLKINEADGSPVRAVAIMS
jgi:kynurenine formamidase